MSALNGQPTAAEVHNMFATILELIEAIIND